MDDFQLETMVSEAAPRVTAPVGLDVHRTRILAEARKRGRGHARAWLGGLAALALVAGGGSVAMASSGMETPWGWIADNVFSISQADGSTCFQGMRVTLEGSSEDSEVMREARAIVSEIDLASLDIAAAEAWVRESSVGHATEGTIRQLAIAKAASEVLFDELAKRGYSGMDVGLFSTITKCD